LRKISREGQIHSSLSRPVKAKAVLLGIAMTIVGAAESDGHGVGLAIKRAIEVSDLACVVAGNGHCVRS